MVSFSNGNRHRYKIYTKWLNTEYNKTQLSSLLFFFFFFLFCLLARFLHDPINKYQWIPIAIIRHQRRNHKIIKCIINWSPFIYSASRLQFYIRLLYDDDVWFTYWMDSTMKIPLKQNVYFEFETHLLHCFKHLFTFIFKMKMFVLFNESNVETLSNVPK